MPADLTAIMKLRVPVIVRLGERRMPIADVVSLVPGSILELNKNAEEELDLMINNRQVGTGVAVKLGENFGIKLTQVGDRVARVTAMGPAETDGPDDDEAARLAEMMLSGQL